MHNFELYLYELYGTEFFKGWWNRVDLNSGYCGDSSKLEPVGHNLNIFPGISVLVVVKLNFVTKNFILVKKVGLVCGLSYLFYIMKSFVPLCYLFMVLFLFIFVS